MPLKLKRRRLRCSFCKKPENEVGKLLGGPGVTICDSCVGVCIGRRGWTEDGQLLSRAVGPSACAALGSREWAISGAGNRSSRLGALLLNA